MDIVNKISNINVTKGRTDKKNVTWRPDVVVCHITEGSYQGAITWLKNPAAQASAHFVVSRKGEITQLVSLSDTAWCNGTSYTPGTTEKATAKIVRGRNTNANCYTVSIEHEGVFANTQGALTQEQENATVFLIKHIDNELKKIYGSGITFDRNHIIGHYEISPKAKPNCPGVKFPFDSILKKLKENDEMVENTKIVVDGKEIELTRILKDGNNFLNARAIGEALGYNVSYDAVKKVAVFTKK